MTTAGHAQSTPPSVGRIRSDRIVDLAYRLRAFGIVAALALLIVVTSVVQPRFLSGQEVNIVLGNTSIMALLTLGEAMVIISRNVDLSIGSVLGLSAYVSGSMFGHLHGVPAGVAIVIAFLVGIGVGTACGIVNGALTTIGRVPSLVVTLATLYIIRGIDILVIGGGQVVASSLPNAFFDVSLKNFHNVPYLTGAVAVVVGVGAYYMRSYRSGRELYAIGSNPDAAQLVGHPERAEGLHGVRPQRGDRGRGRRALGLEVRDARFDSGLRLRAPGDRSGRDRRRGDLRRERQRDRRGSRGAAAEHDSRRALRGRRLALLDPGDRGRHDPDGDHDRPGDLAPAHGCAAEKEVP